MAERPVNACKLKVRQHGVRTGRVFVVNGSHVVAWWRDGTCRVYDMDAGGLICTEFNPWKPNGIRNRRIPGGDCSFFPLGRSVVAIVLRKYLATWDVLAGKELCSVHLEDGLLLDSYCACALNDGLFVLVSEDGELLYYRHARGAEIELQRRVASGPSFAESCRLCAHSECVLVWTWSGEHAAVWGPESDEPMAHFNVPKLLRGALSSQFVVFSALNGVLYIYKTDGEFISCIERFHRDHIWDFSFAGDDLLLSLSIDGEVRFTALSSPPPRTEARVRVDIAPFSHGYSLLIMNGRFAVRDTWHGMIYCFDAPISVAHNFRAHVRALADDNRKVLAYSTTPLHDAILQVMAGTTKLEDACCELLKAENCGRSMSEWVCAHKLLMAAVSSGKIPGDRDFEGKKAHWFEEVYQPVRLVANPDQKDGIKALCVEAQCAGVLSAWEHVAGAITAREDLEQKVETLRGGGENLLQILATVILKQSEMDVDLRKIGARISHTERIQKMTLVVNAVCSFAPMGSGAIAGAAAAALCVSENVPDLFERALDTAVGLQGSFTPTLLEKFLPYAEDMVSQGKWETISLDVRLQLEEGLKGLGLTRQEFHGMLLAARTRRKGVPSLATESQETVNENCDESQTVHKTLVGADGCSFDRNVPEDVMEPQSSIHQIIESVARTVTQNDAEAISRGSHARASPDSVAGGGIERSDAPYEASSMRTLDLAELKKMASRPESIENMNVRDLSWLLVSVMVGFDEEFADDRGDLEIPVRSILQKNRISGKTLVGLVGASEALSVLVDAFQADDGFRAIEGSALCERHLVNFLERLRTILNDVGECQ